MLALVAILGTTSIALTAMAARPGPASAATVAQAGPIGGIGLRLVDAPVAARDDPRARVYIVDHLAPGTTIERHIEVSNTTASNQPVGLYAAAAKITDGQFVGESGTTANELSTWTTVTPGAAEIASAGKLTAMVTITIPIDAAPGENYGVVWAEARSNPGAAGGVTQVSRVGIRLYVSVGPGGAPAADFSIDAVTPGRSSDGQPVISATVHNTGGRALDMSGTLQLSEGPGNLSAGPFAATLGNTLAIGDTQPVSITFDDRLPDGPWQAQITLKSGLVERSATATVTFPSAGNAGATVLVEGSDPPWRFLAGGGALIAGLFVGTLVLRSRSRGRKHRQAPAVPNLI